MNRAALHTHRRLPPAEREVEGKANMDPRTNEITGAIIDSGLKVHKALGPGLLESAYEHCLIHELLLRGISLRQQVPLPIIYEGTHLEASYRLDIIAEDSVLVEIKAVERIIPLHTAQILTYLKLSKLRIGLLLNFNVILFKNGIKRFAL